MWHPHIFTARESYTLRRQLNKIYLIRMLFFLISEGGSVLTHLSPVFIKASFRGSGLIRMNFDTWDHLGQWLTSHFRIWRRRKKNPPQLDFAWIFTRNYELASCTSIRKESLWDGQKNTVSVGFALKSHFMFQHGSGISSKKCENKRWHLCSSYFS